MLTSNRTFGIEIEVIMPIGKTREELASFLNASGILARSENYNHRTGQAYWRVTTDCSIGYSNAEIVSPILQGTAGLEAVRAMADALQAFGCSVNRSTGVHVHVYAGDYDLAALKRVAFNYIKFETFFDFIMPHSRRANNNSMIKSNRGLFGAYDDHATATRAYDAIQACATKSQLIRTVCAGRYYKLNMTALESYGTVEFRQHSGTVDADKLTNWVSLCVTFVEHSATGRPRPRSIEREVTPAEELQRFFKMFSILKPVQKFYRERMRALHRADRTSRTGYVTPARYRNAA
jgi:hypothetical protein